jgi:cell division protein FtsW
MFGSASLGVLAKHEDKFYSILINQFVFGLLGGFSLLFLFSFIHYSYIRKFSFYFYLASFFLTLLFFVPHIGFAHGGAHRWIHLLGFSLQPAELLKYGVIFFWAEWLVLYQKGVHTFKYGLLPFFVIVCLPFLLLLAQPDTGTGAILLFSGFAMYFIAGASWKDISKLFLAGVLGLFVLTLISPYVLERIKTFLDPAHDSQGSSYQLQQSLIAIGSGGIDGRGYMQSVQKFNFLPEPIGDSIFSVISEELGLIGATFLLLLFLSLAFRGYKIAGDLPDLYGALVIVGIVTLYTVQALLNTASMVGLFPLTGVPLPFVSHGGTSLLTSLLGTGIILNISKFRKL